MRKIERFDDVCCLFGNCWELVIVKNVIVNM